MKSIYYMLVVGSLIILFANFQTYGKSLGLESAVSVMITDNSDTPLAGATVHLVRGEDSLRISRIADVNGLALFEQMRLGMYSLEVTYVGFEALQKTIMIRDEQEKIAVKMIEDAVSLGEVTVTARRPLIRQEDDKMIIDPEPLAMISTNTLEILESTPGLFVDQDGGIFLSSATPAAVYINGREQKMSNQDINTILRNLPPNSVDRIEVIRTPSARFAASSSGGIINVVLKRGFKIGRFGSVSSGFNQGNAGNRFLGATINSSGTHSSGYLNLNYSNNNAFEELNSQRFLSDEFRLNQSAITNRNTHQGYVGYGYGYDFSPKLNFSYDGRINGSLPVSDSRNINFINGAEGAPVSQIDNLVTNDSRFLSIQQDFGLNLKLDTIGSEWDTKMSYSLNRNNNFQVYRNDFIFPLNSLVYGEGDNDQTRHFVQLRTDLIYKLPFNFTLETGVSGEFQQYTSDAEFRLNSTGNLETDSRRTNAFNYNEQISAGYLQFSKPLGWEVLLKTGFRVEHTYMQGNQTVPADTNFVVNRTDFFPYVYLSRPVFQIEGFSLQSFLIYRRTITRPGYQSLNPYINYIDQFLYEVGNPALKPQFADNIEANISFNDFPVFAVGRNYTRDIFSPVVYQFPEDETIAVRTFDNLGTSQETYFRALAGIPPGGVYFFAAGAQYNLNEYDGFYENQPLTFSRGSWRFFTFHMLRLGKNTRLTASGFMMTKGLMNFYELETFGQLNLGLRQSFLNNKLTISLSARDVLRTMVTEFTLNQGSISTSGNRYTDNQRFGINIRYNFGIPERRQREQQNMFEFDGMDQ